MPTKEYALLCEFLTQSTNGLYSYMHVFDRTMYKTGTAVALNGFMAVRFRDVPETAHLEIYMTDADNTLVPNATVFSQEVKGPNVHVIARLQRVLVPTVGEYKFSARIDRGEPIPLCHWLAAASSEKSS